MSASRWAADRLNLVMAKAPTSGATDTAVPCLHGGGGFELRARDAPHDHRIIIGLGVPVFAFGLPAAAEVGVGTSVHDAFEAYRELLGQRGYRHVVVAGDSAGGYRPARSPNWPGQRRTGAHRIVMLSPWLDLDIGDRDDRTSPPRRLTCPSASWRLSADAR